MRILGFATIAATAALFASAAQANVLTFDGNICNGGSVCGDGAEIDDTYGDVANVIDVQYNDDRNDGGGNSTLQWWAASYSDLSNVAWGGDNDNVGSPSIFLVPLSGLAVTLNGFDLGAWPNTSRTTQVTIREIGGGTLYSSGTIQIDGQVHSHFSFNLTSTSGLEINWGPNGYNVGIDNVDFTVGQFNGGIPEPSTWAMMILGFGAAGSILRRRTLVRA